MDERLASLYVPAKYCEGLLRMKKVGLFGGSFDPFHKGHLTIARVLVEQFELDEFVFIPAFHAPHKLRKNPTSAYDRFAMLCLATENEPKILVSKVEIEAPERPYSVDTLETLRAERPDAQIFFIMGADSWMDITTWRQWERVLSFSNNIIVTRPGVEIGLSHVTDAVRNRVVDLRRGGDAKGNTKRGFGPAIYITDWVDLDISATEIRRRIRENDPAWRDDLPGEVANYIEKYQIYS